LTAGSVLRYFLLRHLTVEVDGTCTLRVPSEAYGGYFGSESDALTPDNTIPRQNNGENSEAAASDP